MAALLQMQSDVSKHARDTLQSVDALGQSDRNVIEIHMDLLRARLQILALASETDPPASNLPKPFKTLQEAQQARGVSEGAILADARRAQLAKRTNVTRTWL